MYKSILLALVVLCSSIVVGCTSLHSQKLMDQSTPPTPTPSGLTYRLPAKQYSVKTTYEITWCKAQGTDAFLEANISASLTESLIGAEAYTIDYKLLSGWTKVTNSEFQLSEAGLLTGVNASVTDQSKSVITNSVTAVASIARAIATHIPASASDMYKESIWTFNQSIESQFGRSFDYNKLFDLQTDDKTILHNNIAKQLSGFNGKKVDPKLQKQMKQLIEDPCEPVTKAVTSRKEAEIKLEKEKKNDKERAKCEEKISQADLQIKALNDLVDTYNKLGDYGEKQKLLKRVQLQEKIKAETEATLNVLGESQSDKLAKELTEVKGKLFIVGSLDVVPKANDKPAVVEVVSTAGLSQLFEDRLDSKKIILPEVTFEVKAHESNSGEGSKTPAADKIGIAYRVPVAAVARVQCSKGCNPAPSSTILVEKSTQVPQFGPIGSLDLENMMFDENLVEIAFNGATGAPSKLTFRAKSKAEAASETVRDAAGTYLQLQKDRRDDRIAANKAYLDQSSSLMSLEKTKSDLTLTKVKNEAAVTTTLADLQQSLVENQLKLIRDQQRLDAVRTGTATKDEVELEALKTQEELLAQRLKILKLEQDIANQQAKAVSSK